MRIALAQLNFHTGNFSFNTEKIISYINKAKKENADLIVFPELCICGYPPGDFLEFADFIKQCEESVTLVASHCNGIAAIVGSPSVNPVIEGKDLYNSAWFLAEGKVQSIHNKSLLPTYDVFEEYRHFESGRSFNTVTYKGVKLAITICEDLWNINNNPLYISSPMDELIKEEPDIMINIAASPFSYQQAENRKKVLQDNVNVYKIPLFYVNHVGAHTQIIFDGGSMVLDHNGQVHDRMDFFTEDFKIYELPLSVSKISDKEYFENKMEQIYEALILGIRDYFGKMGFKKAILGLSGGIDSAVVLALAVEALGKENVTSLLLPSQYSSEHSKSDAAKMAEILQTPYFTIPIEKAFNSFNEILEPYFKGLPFGIAEENMQARCRALILMAFSNKFGSILLNTSNKSEMAVGYGTLYGDMCGGISVLGDVYKTEVYELAKYINRNKEIIPKNIITKAPSAELRPGQKDSDSLPPYDILDKVLFNYIELHKSPQEIIAAGFDEALVRRVLKLVNTNEYKRYQAPPVLRISPKAFGQGRKMPIVAKYLS